MKAFFFALGLPLGGSSLFAAALTPAQTEFFETKIRPVLVERCYQCHSTEAGKDKGGLLLDTRQTALKGGDTGPAIVPGDLKKSLLIAAIRRGDPETAMPPKGKGEALSPEQVADFEQWVREGAPDPREGGGSKPAMAGLLETARAHWAFQPVPKWDPAKWGPDANVVDALLPAQNQEADPRTLIRRAFLTLTGLPPKAERIERFGAAYAAEPKAAWNALVEELLASPRYGERWARHWLDVARYADTMGAIFNGDDAYPFAFTYRDWVIQSFNEDKPYNQFVLEQLAADLLPDAKPDDNRNLAALGFLTLGRRTDRRVDDNVYDDRVDVIGRGLMGLTVGCARCHDHKLEPIPTVDYYSLYGILRSCTEPKVYPQLKPQPQTPQRKEFEERNRSARAEFMRVHVLEAERSLEAIRERLGDYLLALHEGGYQTTSQNAKLTADLLEPRRLHAGVYDRFVSAWAKWGKGQPSIFGPWEAFAQLAPEDFRTKGEAMGAAFAQNADRRLEPGVARRFQKVKLERLRDIADLYNQLWSRELDAPWGEKWRGQMVAACVPTESELELPVADLEASSIDRVKRVETEEALDKEVQPLRAALLAEGSPLVWSGRDFLGAKLYLSRDVAQGLRRSVSKPLLDLESHPGAPIRLMALQEAQPFQAKVFIRGNPKTLGADAPRGWLTVLRTSHTPEFPKAQSGRLEFAREVVSRENPLTARVLVNRVWAWHFGEGLVRTPSDFGFRGEKPTHPELLDALAAWFMDHGWSVKKLQRLLLQSALWKQAGRLQPLDFEAFRDSLLAVSGVLEETPGGKPDDLSKKASLRRTVYALVDRKTLPNLFRNFDFPDPNTSAAQRSRTSLSPQALFLLNSGFVLDRARDLGRLAQAQGADGAVEHGIRDLYRRVLQRAPTEAELSRAQAYLAAYPKNDVVVPEVQDWAYGSGEYDAQTQRVRNFEPLKFVGDKVAGAGGMELNREGGQPVQNRAIIRRWVAPQAGKVNVYAELVHLTKEGAGVTSRVVSSRGGLLGEWTAAHTAVTTTLNEVVVQKGETLDFLTVCVGDPKGDTFRWAPTITMPTAEMPGMAGMAMRWDARGNFMDPSKMPAPLSALEELAHVLLLSNEFAVVE
jgi:hypothetical protein